MAEHIEYQRGSECPDCGSAETTVYPMGDGAETLYCDNCKREEPLQRNVQGRLSDLEKKVVDLVETGYTRWKIAEEIGLGETTVRSVIRRLCQRFDCSMQELPNVIPREER